MDLFILDKNLQAIALLDTYSSLIWTDRYNECGDFEIYTPISESILEFIKQDHYIASKNSEHVMIIEHLSITSDMEEGNNLTITGRSLESILDRRVIWGQKTLSGNFQNGVKTLLEENIIKPTKPERVIENFIFEESDDPAITGLTIEAQYTGDNLYEVICNLCKERDIGFKVTLNDTNQFVFKLYSGSDRSYDQTKYPYVVFSPRFDNLLSSNYIESKSSWKNVTLVGGEGEGTYRRYTAVGNTSGLDRRELFTDARDISSSISEDITELFSFNEFPGEVFNESTKTFVANQLFNSSTADVKQYAGRTVSITIPTYSNASGAAPGYSTVLLDENKKYISTLQVWEKYEGSTNSGMLTTYELLLPDDAKILYSSMFSQVAIDRGEYYGELTDFNCTTVKLSRDEYTEQLRQRGREDLIENEDIISFEGQAEVTTMFQYGRDFFMGDIVQVANEYGHESTARILELITSENEEGFTVYPTFSNIENDLPNGFVELEYIESTGYQYIDVDFKPNTLTRLIMDIEARPFDAARCIFGTRHTNAAGSDDAFAVLITGEKAFRSDWYATSVAGTVEDVGVRTTVDMNKGSTTAWGVTVVNKAPEEDKKENKEEGTEEEPIESAFSLYLFGMSTRGNFGSGAKMKLYSCKIYDDGTLIRDFVPAINDVGDTGLYDLIYKKFYKNAGKSEFLSNRDPIPGPDPEPEPEPEPEDPHTILLLHGETLEDSSMYKQTLENTNVVVSAEQSYFGGRSLKFNGSSAYLRVRSGDFNFGSKDWTVDWREYCTGNSASRFTLSPNGGSGGLCAGGDANTLYVSSTGTGWELMKNAFDKTPNTWVHWAVVRSGNTLYTFKNGKRFWSGTYAKDIFWNGQGFIVGSFLFDASHYFGGYIDEFRVSDIARWTSDFTPPTSPY